MGKRNYKRKRSLDTSSGSSNFGDLSINKSIAEEKKSDVKQKEYTQQQNKEFQPVVCGTVSLRAEGDDISQSDEEMSNPSYNSDDNLCTYNFTEQKCFESYFETLAKRRSHSLEGRSEQMRNESTTSLITNNKRLFQRDLFRKDLFQKDFPNDFLKVASSRRLEEQRRVGDSKEGKQLTHPKKR